MKTAKPTLEFSLAYLSQKEGASPGAIMQDASGERYMVKLGIPKSSTKYLISSHKDIENLASQMSRESCKEKAFFNIAEAIGNSKYQTPQTSIVFLKPEKYTPLSATSANRKSIAKCLKDKIKIDRHSLNTINLDSTLEQLNTLDIAHFTSKMISPYHDIGDYYNYHNSFINGEGLRKYPSLPKEPKGLGAFFALSCCMGNNDCIGAQGKNAGFNPETEHIIIIDGGNANPAPHLVNHYFPTADNNSCSLNFYEDLSIESQKEACESFIKFANLTPKELRHLITDNEKTATLLGEQYIAENVEKLQTQQTKIVDVFYDDMVRLGCKIPQRIFDIKEEIDSTKDIPPLLENITFQSTTSEESLSSSDESTHSKENAKENTNRHITPPRVRNKPLLAIQVSPQSNFNSPNRISIESTIAAAEALSLAGVKVINQDNSINHQASPSYIGNKRRRTPISTP